MTSAGSLTCAECGQPLCLGQPIAPFGAKHHAHVGCGLIAGIRALYGAQALISETLPPLRRAEAA